MGKYIKRRNGLDCKQINVKLKTKEFWKQEFCWNLVTNTWNKEKLNCSSFLWGKVIFFFLKIQGSSTALSFSTPSCILFSLSDIAF